MSLNVVSQTGTYVGNSGTQSITVGWQPAFVMIMSTRTTGSAAQRATSFKVDGMPDDDFMECSTAAQMTITNGITLTSTGFSVGSDNVINQTGITFHWVAIKKGPWIETGSYVGDGNVNGDFQTILANSGQPEAVMVFEPNATNVWYFQTASQWTVQSSDYEYTTQWSEDIASVPLRIQSDGFRAYKWTASLRTINDNGNTYYYAFFRRRGATRSFVEGSWTETGSGTVSEAVGFQPKWVLSSGGGGSPFCTIKSDTMAGDDSGRLGPQYDWDTTNGITLTATGFTLGTDLNVRNGDVCYYLCGYL